MILAYFCVVLDLFRKSPPKIAIPKILPLVGSCANLLVLTHGCVVLLVDLSPLCVTLALTPIFHPKFFLTFPQIRAFPARSVVPANIGRPTPNGRPTERTSDVRNTTDVRKFPENYTLAISLENQSSVCDSPFGPTEPSLSNIAGSRNLGTLVLTKAKLRAHSSISNSAPRKLVKSEIDIQKKRVKRRTKEISKLLSKRERNKCYPPQTHVSSSSPLN